MSHPENANDSDRTGHVFISHAKEDHDFVLVFAAALRERGIPVWIDDQNIAAGMNWYQAIHDALLRCAHFVIVLSPASVQSQGVLGELYTALDEGKPVLPLLYERCQIPFNVRAIQYVDFQDRSADDDAALKEVLRALDAFEAPPLPQPLEPQMVPIPAGDFLMGSDPRKDDHARSAELPQHTVCLPEYSIARTPVTNAQYMVFIQARQHPQPETWVEGKPPQGKEGHPVAVVSWYDAMAYCDWLAEIWHSEGKILSHQTVRLPTEAEWEKGARGTDGRIYPWGNGWDVTRCNCKSSGRSETTLATFYPEGASPYGLLDMAGNVYEWTVSLWGNDRDTLDYKYPYDPADGRENLDAANTMLRVLRGGSSNSRRQSVRCAHRYKHVPSHVSAYDGFRVCVVAQEK